MFTIGYSALTTPEFMELFKMADSVGLDFEARDNQIIMAAWVLDRSPRPCPY